jgi:hypothetical protein
MSCLNMLFSSLFFFLKNIRRKAFFFSLECFIIIRKLHLFNYSRFLLDKVSIFKFNYLSHIITGMFTTGWMLFIVGYSRGRL